MKRIKIFATQSQSISENVFIQNKIITPILGGAKNKKNIAQLQGDDEGDNISAQNDVLCELTTQYWAWKNIDVDYYGFCHYRRFFSFNPNHLESDDWKIVNCSFANIETKKRLFLDNLKQMEKVISGYDILTPEVVDLKQVGYGSIYEQFVKTPFMKAEALDLTLQIIRESFPEYYCAAKKYIYGQKFYPFNMFIMRKELFCEYSKWLFDVLEKLTTKLDMRNYSIQNRRIPAHIGERLLGVYFTYLLEKQPLLKIKELQVGFIHNVIIEEEVKPIFKESIPIVMAANDFFTPILSAALCSLIESSGKHNYDIVILERDIAAKTKERLQSLFRNKDNFSLRFYNVGSRIDSYDLFISQLISVETYYRFLIPELFPNYSKIVYLDGDIIVKKDIAELFNNDIGKNLIGACHDVTCAGLVNGFDEESYQYCKNKMKLKNPLEQFNAGVMIMNLEEIRANFTTEYMLKFAEDGKFKFWDQDVLNILFEGKVKWLDSAWNYFVDEKDGWRGKINQFAPKELYELYENAGKNPYIYHFAGNEKPWFDPYYEHAEVFWSYLRKTPFYEIMLQRRMVDTSCYFINQNKEEVEPLRHIAKRILKAIFPYESFRGKIVRKIAKKFRCKNGDKLR
ncbi:DUF4422 domain-containing protein [Enterocloster aldenensis]|uniref:DUF4422 domain-containing protein n=1 Tax=Enterocloster aldenensis TaxID=358742 RepID=UPI003511B6A8